MCVLVAGPAGRGGSASPPAPRAVRDDGGGGGSTSPTADGLRRGSPLQQHRFLADRLQERLQDRHGDDDRDREAAEDSDSEGSVTPGPPPPASPAALNLVSHLS